MCLFAVFTFIDDPLAPVEGPLTVSVERVELALSCRPDGALFWSLVVVVLLLPPPELLPASVCLLLPRMLTLVLLRYRTTHGSRFLPLHLRAESLHLFSTEQRQRRCGSDGRWGGTIGGGSGVAGLEPAGPQAAEAELFPTHKEQPRYR
jgi:hypothetical protein